MCCFCGCGWVSPIPPPILVMVVDVVVCFFFFFLVAVADISGQWLIFWGWSVVMGCGG